MTVSLTMSGVNLVFINDTSLSLDAAAALVNTLPGMTPDGADTLVTRADLARYVADYPYSGVHLDDDREREEVREIRTRIRELWRTDRDGAVPLVNAMLADGAALPRLVRHDDFDWHIHATDDDAPLAMRILVEVAMAFVDVIRADAYDRVRICAADDCQAVYVDFSRNGSKRYCDTGNCGNRMNVNAYRRRIAEETN